MPVISWIKRNKLVTLLLLIVLYLIFSSGRFSPIPLGSMSVSLPSTGIMAPEPVMEGASGPRESFSQPRYGNFEAAPQTDTTRLVVETSNLSLLVKDVVNVRDKVVDFAQRSGGYMVSSQISNPQDAPTATVVVRVPSDKLKEALIFFRSLAVKIVSENLTGEDVTDEYVDIEKRIEIQERTRARFEEILAQAREITDITQLTAQIINIQDQIDSLKGQQKYLSQNAKLAKLTLYLSTDEIALPYAPSETFRPKVIFKLAMRSLVGHLRQVVTMLIWAGVYAVIWLPLGLCVWWINRWWQRKKTVNR